MAYIRVFTVLFIVAALAAGAVVLRGAVGVALGYSAKQLCSGVFVSGLPAEFVQRVDIVPRMAILGPALSSLQLDVDESLGLASAELFGARVQAVHNADRGCVLHGIGEGVSPRTLVAFEDQVPTPADLETAVQKAFDEPAGGGRNTLALLVSVRGEVMLERYTAPVTAATPLQGWSMNKSLMGTWVGMQADRGKLDPTQPVSTLAPEIPRQAPGKTGIDERLTLLHLLQMESGLDFEEVYGPGSDVTEMLYRTDAMWTVPAGAGHAYPPGQHFYYSSGDTVLASYLWQQSLDRPYWQWIEEEFTRPLGLNTLVPESDASGVQVGSSYAYLTTRDWARVGHLWLDAWHGRTDLLSQGWIRASAKARDSDPRGRYGRTFWLNTNGVAFDGLPDDIFFATGNAGQYVVVIPEWEMIVVRLGLTQPGVPTGTDDFLRALAAWRD